MIKKLLIALTCFLPLASGCTLYKSSDRDNFNSNGFANSAKTLALAPDFKPKDAAACWTAPDIKDFGLPAPADPPRVDVLPMGLRLFITQNVDLSPVDAPDTSIQAGVMCCYFVARSSGGGFPPHVDFFIQQSRAEVGQLAENLVQNWAKRGSAN